MNKELCDKMNARSIAEREKFREELKIILSDRVYASIYGITGNDYNCLPQDKVEKAEEMLYHNLFEINKLSKISGVSAAAN
jgi:hypothetical protein